MKTYPRETIVLEKIVGGGQALGTLADGRKVFVWGGLPGEKVEIQLTKSKSKLAEAIVTEVIEPSPERVEPKDAESYLSTSPWQIMSFDAEIAYKQQLIDEAFALHHVALPGETSMYSDNVQYNYRNKVEFSWYGDLRENATGSVQTLDIAFYRRGTHGKVPVNGTSLAREEINQLARTIRDTLSVKGVEARQLKTLLIRCDRTGNTVWQLYVKDQDFNAIDKTDAAAFPAQGGEVIYSDPKSPASRITKRLASFGNTTLTDVILDVPFRYAAESFFQVNIPVYEKALKDMKCEIERKLQNRHKRVTLGGADPKYESGEHIIDLYSGVGTIGLTVGGDNVTLVEISEDAVREMRMNIAALHKNARAVLAPSEKALDYITSEAVTVVDPPRAGLHADVIARLLEITPPRIIYLSCSPATQARDVAALLEKYTIVHHQGYNFFPRTPHIEHLVVLERKH